LDITINILKNAKATTPPLSNNLVHNRSASSPLSKPLLLGQQSFQYLHLTIDIESIIVHLDMYVNAFNQEVSSILIFIGQEAIQLVFTFSNFVEFQQQRSIEFRETNQQYRKDLYIMYCNYYLNILLVFDMK